jgi:lysophospholipase L1-like esterase
MFRRLVCPVLTLAMVVLMAGSLIQPASAADKFFFKDGDCPIVFLGDSITEQRMYTAFIESYVLTRFPTWKVCFRNIGWGGDTSWLAQRQGFENGLKRDILALKPAAITIDFGMNDARGGDGNLPKYIECSTKLAQSLKATGARVALVTPSPEEHYQPNQPGGSAYNNMLWKYSLALKDIAKKEDVAWVDQYTPFIDVIRTGRGAGVLSNVEGTGARLIPDGVHPNWAGHLVMAVAILEGLHAPSDVSSASIDAKDVHVRGSRGCEISLLKKSPNGVVSFKRVDSALPMPINPEARMVLDVPGFAPLRELSDYHLRVVRLDAPAYDLAVDGQKTAHFTKEQLDAGVNLSLVAGPITDQSLKILQMVLDKNNMYYYRWRNVQLGIDKNWQGSGPEFEAKRTAELKRVDQQIADKEAEINRARLPMPHEFTLTPSL